MMMPLRFTIFCSLGLLMATIAHGEEPPIRYGFQVFQLTGGFTQETSLTEKIRRSSDESWEKMKDRVVLFDKAEFRNGKDKLSMNPKRCFWNEQELTFEEGHEAKLPEQKIKMIYSPNLVRKEKELVRLKIEAKQPFEFMEAQRNDLFKLKRIELPTGLDIEIRTHRGKDGRYEIDYLEIELRTVHDREPPNGTQLPVGKPILDESEYILKLSVKEYRSYGILLQPKGTDGLIIIRFEVDDVT